MLTILQARLQQYMNQEIPHVQAGFRKGRGTRDQMANTRRMIEKQITNSASLTTLKDFTVSVQFSSVTQSYRSL